jgi:hypothetical protein
VYGEGVLNLCEPRPVQRCPNHTKENAVEHRGVIFLEEENYIKFIASISPLQSAIQISGMKDGAKIKLDVPQTEIAAVLELQKLAGEIFEVIIIPLDKKVVNKKIKFLKDIENENMQS